jgi:hypothetical protein
MRFIDGLVLPFFMGQAHRVNDFTVFGDSIHFRCFCEIDYLVDGK